ncbi:MAG: hypothetical protein R3350_06720, partial [Saprospiraceae bacterium]|nr:hypothetical protein [Saprospiraceae bacterium]
MLYGKIADMDQQDAKYRTNRLFFKIHEAKYFGYITSIRKIFKTLKSRILFSLLITAALLPRQPRAQHADIHGCEWIDQDRSYFSMSVAKPGLYRIFGYQMKEAGIPIEDIPVDQYCLYYLGEEVPLLVEEDGFLKQEEHLTFYGQPYRGQLDKFLFEHSPFHTGGSHGMLNPEYSLITDTAVYFLSWKPPGQQGLRYEKIENEIDDAGSSLPGYPHKEIRSYTEQHISPRYDAEDLVALSSFDPGEGFGSSWATEHELSFEISHPVEEDGQARLRLRLIGNGTPHRLRIRHGATELFHDSLGKYQILDTAFVLSLAKLLAKPLIRISGETGRHDRYSLALAELTYHRRFDADGKNQWHFQLPARSERSHVEVQNFAESSAPPLLIDPGNRRYLIPRSQDGLIKFTLPPASGETGYLLLASETALLTAPLP